MRKRMLGGCAPSWYGSGYYGYGDYYGSGYYGYRGIYSKLVKITRSHIFFTRKSEPCIITRIYILPFAIDHPAIVIPSQIPPVRICSSI
jgi:hypothetical protein